MIAHIAGMHIPIHLAPTGMFVTGVVDMLKPQVVTHHVDILVALKPLMLLQVLQVQVLVGPNLLLVLQNIM